MNRYFYVLLVILTSFVFILPAQATVYYTVPQTVYVQPSPSYELGQAIGSIFGALIANSQQRADEKKMQQLRENIQNGMQEYADKEAHTFSSLINENGEKNTFEMLNQYFYQKGYRYKTDFSNGIAFLSYSYKPNGDPNAPDMVYEYSINTNEKNAVSL